MAIFAVDIIYLQLLMWIASLLAPVAVSISSPVILYFHFKWLKVTLKYLTARPFTADASRLRVTLQRVLCTATLIYAIGIFAVLLNHFPHEQTCDHLTHIILQV